jgi:hypothetical protein
LRKKQKRALLRALFAIEINKKNSCIFSLFFFNVETNNFGYIIAGKKRKYPYNNKEDISGKAAVLSFLNSILTKKKEAFAAIAQKLSYSTLPK